MKIASTLIFSFIFIFSLSAQITISPDIITFETTGEAVDVKIDVTNNTTEHTNIYWIFEKGENFPDDWDITVCDDETCYLKNTIQSSQGLPNDMTPGYAFKFKFTIDAKGIPASTFGILHLYDDSKFENEVAVSKLPITSVSDNEIKDITLYPNPATDYFQISNDELVKSIEILNITGQQLMKESHVPNQAYSISHLPKGMFLAVLRDENGDKLSTLRLLK